MTSGIPISRGVMVAPLRRSSGFLEWGTWLVMIVGLLLAPDRAFGSESKLVASGEVKEEYNSNIFFDPSGGLKDFVTTVSPVLEWKERTERLDFSLLGRVDAVAYAQYGAFDHINYSSTANLQYRLTPGVEVSAGGGVSQDWRPSRDLLLTGLVYGDVKRDHWAYNVAGNYLLTESTSLGVHYDQLADTYNNVNYLDTQAQNASIFLSRDLDAILPLLKGKAAFSYSDYSFTGQNSLKNSTVTSYAWTLGVSRDLEPKWNFIVNGGVFYAVSEFKVVGLQPINPFVALIVIQDQTTTTWGGLGDISLVYKGESTDAQITFREDLVPASGYGATRRTGLMISVDRKFTYEWQGSLSAWYYLNQADPGQYSQTGLDIQTLTGRAGLKYDFTKDMAMEASYSYTRIMNQTANTVADQNLFMVRFTIKWNLLE